MIRKYSYKSTIFEAVQFDKYNALIKITQMKCSHFAVSLSLVQLFTSVVLIRFIFMISVLIRMIPYICMTM